MTLLLRFLTVDLTRISAPKLRARETDTRAAHLALNKARTAMTQQLCLETYGSPDLKGRAG